MRSSSKLLVMLATLLLAPASHAASLHGVSIVPSPTGEEVHFATSGSVTPRKLFTLNAPDRVVIDLPPLAATGIAMPPDYRGTLVRGLRFGRFNATTSRIVIDVAGPVKPDLRISAASGLVIGLTPSGAAASISSASPFVVLQQGTAATPVIPQAAKPLVVIDAGHGGQDPGALGLHDTREKEVTLAFAQRLREALLRTGRYRVALTRDDDRFVTLGDRVLTARQMKGDIFISFHADSNPRPEAQGVSVYTLSENASDAEAAALAERENKADILPGLDLGTTDEDVAAVLIDLAQRETMNKSARFADLVVEHLHGKVKRLPRTHRFAGFRVLKAPDIPSVLVELGFLSNADDEKLLKSREYQGLIVSSLVKALDAYKAQQKL